MKTFVYDIKENDICHEHAIYTDSMPLKNYGIYYDSICQWIIRKK